MISLKILVGMTGTNRSNNDMNTRLQIKLVGVEDFQPLHWGIEIPGNIAVSGNISPLRRNMFSLRLLSFWLWNKHGHVLTPYACISDD